MYREKRISSQPWSLCITYFVKLMNSAQKWKRWCVWFRSRWPWMSGLLRTLWEATTWQKSAWSSSRESKKTSQQETSNKWDVLVSLWGGPSHTRNDFTYRHNGWTNWTSNMSLISGIFISVSLGEDTTQDHHMASLNIWRVKKKFPGTDLCFGLRGKCL